MKLPLLYKTPCVCHQQAVSNTEVAGDDVTLPHSRGIVLQTPAVLYRPQ